MAIFEKLFGSSKARDALIPLYDTVVERARDPQWYKDGGVPDTQDGRFDMIAAIITLVLLRLEGQDKAHASESALLAEVFIEDMDGQMREIGVGDVIVGKHVGKMMGALGGRMTAYRQCFAGGEELKPALVRNLYRGDEPEEDALGFTAAQLQAFSANLAHLETQDILAGELPPL